MRLIDADALIDGYRHMGYDPNEHPEESYMEGWCKGFNAAVDHCIGHVIHAPTVEPEQKTEKWVKVSEQPYFRKHFHRVCCSVCHAEGNSKWEFCPRCGSKMEVDHATD